MDQSCQKTFISLTATQKEAKTINLKGSKSRVMAKIAKKRKEIMKIFVLLGDKTHTGNVGLT